MIKLIFILFGIEATLGDACGIWGHLHSFGEVKMFLGLFQDFMDRYIKAEGSSH